MNPYGGRGGGMVEKDKKIKTEFTVGMIVSFCVIVIGIIVMIIVLIKKKNSTSTSTSLKTTSGCSSCCF